MISRHGRRKRTMLRPSLSGTLKRSPLRKLVCGSASSTGSNPRSKLLGRSSLHNKLKPSRMTNDNKCRRCGTPIGETPSGLPGDQAGELPPARGLGPAGPPGRCPECSECRDCGDELPPTATPTQVRCTLCRVRATPGAVQCPFAWCLTDYVPSARTPHKCGPRGPANTAALARLDSEPEPRVLHGPALPATALGVRHSRTQE